MRRALLVALAGVALAGVVVRAPLAFGCSCAVSNLRDQIKAADAVFVGVASATRTAAQDAEGAARFEVAGVYKGSVEPTTEVRTPATGDTCGIEVIVGQRYEVFANRGSDGLHTELCSGTGKDSGALARAGLRARAPSTVAAPSLAPRALAGTDNPGRGRIIGAAAAFLVAMLLASVLVRGRLGGSPPRAV